MITPIRRLMQWLILVLLASPAYAEAGPLVMVSIKPVHALVAGVMEGVGSPVLIIPGNQSPHDFTLKPSQAAALNKANLVFLIDQNFEHFLTKPLATLSHGNVVELSKTKGMVLYTLRHTDADDHGPTDYHIWLSPENALLMLDEITTRLATLDPRHAKRYEANHVRLRNYVANLHRQTALKIAAAQRKANAQSIPYLAYHDAYQYFERAYHIDHAGFLLHQPEQGGSVRDMEDMQERLAGRKLHCVFLEPQFRSPALMRIAEETGAKVKMLNPDGSMLPEGPTVYMTLMADIASAAEACITGE